MSSVGCRGATTGLDSRGVARGDLGDLGGMDDLRAALAMSSLEIGAGYDTAVVYNSLIEPLWLTEVRSRR